MKKITVLLVSFVTVIAVVFVALFGTRPQGIVPVVYIESLTIEPGDGSQIKENPSLGKMLTLTYDPAQEVEVDGSHRAIPYLFTTKVLPEGVTNRRFEYYFDEEASSTFLSFASSPEAPYSGAFLIKRYEKKRFAYATIHVRPLDGGSGKGDTLTLKIDYKSVWNPSGAPTDSEGYEG